MPYIPQVTRVDLSEICSAIEFNNDLLDSPGTLNFLITVLLTQYIENKALNYQTINDIVGALEGAKLEFYSRVARPYEDSKIKQNGDVYEV